MYPVESIYVDVAMGIMTTDGFLGHCIATVPPLAFRQGANGIIRIKRHSHFFFGNGIRRRKNIHLGNMIWGKIGFDYCYCYYYYYSHYMAAFGDFNPILLHFTINTLLYCT